MKCVQKNWLLLKNEIKSTNLSLANFGSGILFLRNRLRKMKRKNRIKLKDLASDLGVSAATVSRALNDSHEISNTQKQRIREYAEQVGYQPDRTAANLRRNRTKTIGLVIPSVAYNFNTQLINGIERIVFPKGYKVLIFQTMEDAARECEAIDYLLSIKVDGIIASIGAGTHSYDHFLKVRALGKPLVLVDRTSDQIEASPSNNR